jgi:uncharacterized protein YjgD (DUF1641 family)
MAQPISSELPPPDPRAVLNARIQSAPAEHAEAVLATYEVLQELHNQGVLEMLKAGLGSGNKILAGVVEVAKKPESIRTICNFLILVQALGSIEPALVSGFVRSLPEAIAQTKAHQANPPGFFGILSSFRNRNMRRGLVLINSLLEAFGRNLPPGDEGLAL